MSIFQCDDYLGNFRYPSCLDDIGPPQQIAFYSCFVNDTNDYRFNDYSALRRYKGGELRLPLQLETAADREEFCATSVRLDQVPRPSLAPVIAACAGPRGVASLRKADIITRRGVLSSLGAGEHMTLSVICLNGKLYIDKKNVVPSSAIRHDGPYFGHCFEEACTVPSTWEQNGRFCSIVSRRLGNLNIVVAGEVDCAEGGYPRLENYRELKTQNSGNHRHWPKWYLQSFILGVPTLVLGNRSRRNLLTDIQTMSMEQLLATATSHSPEFDKGLALGRIHSILSALVEHCRTRAGHPYSGRSTYELQIHPQGGASVLSVPPDKGVTEELLLAWACIKRTDVLVGGPIPPPPPPPVSELLSWAVAAPFIVYCTFKIYHNIYLKIRQS